MIILQLVEDIIKMSKNGLFNPMIKKSKEKYLLLELKNWIKPWKNILIPQIDL